MRKLFLLLLLSCSIKTFSQTVVVTDDAAYTTGQASSVLDVNSVTKGFLAPRMTQTQRLAIASPTDGLLVYQTDGTKGFYNYNSTLAAWVLHSSGTGTGWNTSGNTGTSLANFLGTSDNHGIKFRTNNVQRMFLDSLGNTAIGTTPTFSATAPEKFLVDAGVTTSFNVINGKGSINNYLQLNIQNNSAGTAASSDVVATADNGNETTKYIDMGINSSGNTAAFFGGANDAYLYNEGQNLLIGTSTTGKVLAFLTGGGTQSTNERMRIDGSGNVGIGLTNPAYRLGVKDTMEIRHTGSSVSSLLFTNTAGSGDMRIAGDGGDIFWQGGGGRSLQMGSYWTTVLMGDRQTASFPSFISNAATANVGVLVQAQRDASIPMVFMQKSATQTANLTEWRTSSGTALVAIDEAGSVGIGTNNPSTKLHIIGTNPLTLNGVQLGTTTSTDSLLTISSGLVKKIPVSLLGTATSSWNVTGNTGTTLANFLGTSDNHGIKFRTNNVQRMFLDSLGNTAIGATPTFSATAPEKLLVDAGVTTSFNVINGKGSINNYLQLNIQNNSAGTAASSDVVATADNGNETTRYIDMGINSSGNTSTFFGGANDAYLYNEGQNLLIGTSTVGKALVFLTGGGTQSTNERMRIDGSGNVGIGTNSPAATLDVSGTYKLGTSGTALTNMIKTSFAVSDATTFIYSATRLITVTVTGANVNANLIINPRTALPTGIGIAWSRVSSTNNVVVCFTNTDSTARAVGNVTFDVTVIQ